MTDGPLLYSEGPEELSTGTPRSRRGLLAAIGIATVAVAMIVSGLVAGRIVARRGGRGPLVFPGGALAAGCLALAAASPAPPCVCQPNPASTEPSW